MGLRINTNVEAFNAHRNLTGTSEALSKSMQRLSSGLRINTAADDAAGLGISERMRGQIGGLEQATRNAQDGISLVQTAEGSMQEMQAILHRVRDLAVQYMNGTNDVNARAAITAEVGQLGAELQRMIGSANFNGTQLLSGTTPATSPLLTLQVGPNGTAADELGVPAVSLDTMAAVTLGAVFSNFTSGVTTNLLTNIDALNDGVSAARATYGAIQNRLEHTVSALGIYQENLMAAESRIRDVDMAAEMTNMTKLQILQQSGTAMLAQANQASQSVLALLQN
jgi:flagellin